jgi:hypothetical protein
MGGFREQGGETALELNSLKVDRFESRFGAKLDGPRASPAGPCPFRRQKRSQLELRGRARLRLQPSTYQW